MAMKIEVTIKTDGETVTTVVDKGTHLCSEVYRVTNAVGKQISDEEIGPEGDRVEEIQT